MLNYRSLQVLDPRFAEEDPRAVAQFVRSAFYPDAPEEDFARAFLSGGPEQLTYEDLAAFDPRFAAEDPNAVYEFVRSQLLPDLSEKDDVRQRALFTRQEPERGWDAALADTGRKFMLGTGDLVGVKAPWLLGKALPDALGGQALLDTAHRVEGNLERARQEQISPEQQAREALQQQRQQERVLEGQGLLQRAGAATADYLTHPDLLAGVLAESLPSTIALGAAGRGIAALGTAAGMAAPAVTTAARAGMAVGEGAIEGAEAGMSAENRIRRIPVEALAETPEYQQLRRETGITDPIKLRELLAQKAGTVAFAFSAPLAALAGYAGGALDTRVFVGRGGPVSVPGAVLKEGGEEIVQEGGNTFGSNLGVRLYGDPEQPLMEGVPEAAGTGFAAGVGQGAVLRSIEPVQDWWRGEEYTGLKRAAQDVIGKARRGEALSASDIALAEMLYPGMPARFFDKSRAAAEQDTVETALASAETEVATLLAQPDAAVVPAPEADDFADLTFDFDSVLAESQIPPGPRAHIGTPETRRLDNLGRTAVEGLLGRPVDLSGIAQPTPSGPVTNADVVSILGEVEASTRNLTQTEEDFRRSVLSGRVDSAGVFADGLTVAAAPEVIRGFVLGRLNSPSARLERAAAQAPATPQARLEQAAAQAPTEAQQLSMPPQSKRQASIERATSRVFKTRKEAQLAAEQTGGLPLQPYKNDKGRWQLRVVEQAAQEAPQAAQETPAAEAVPSVTPSAATPPAAAATPPAAAATPPAAAVPALTWTRRKATVDEANASRADPTTALHYEFHEGDPIYEEAGGRVRIVSRLWNFNSAERQFQVYVDGVVQDTEYSLRDAKAAAARRLAAETSAAEEEAVPASEAKPAAEDDFEAIEVGGRDYQGLSRGQLSAASVPVDVTIESTGETRTVEQNAAQALDEIDADLQRHENLLNCLRSSK